MLAPISMSGQTLDLIQPYQHYDDARARNDFVTAIDYGRQALEIAEARYGANSVEVVHSIERIAEVLALAGELAQAAVNYRRALDIKERELGSAHPDLIPILEALTDIASQQQNFAETLLNRILGIERAIYGNQHDNVLTTLNELRNLYIHQDRLDDVARTEADIEAAMLVERGLDFEGPDVNRHRYGFDDGHATVRVFYGTNRARSGEEKAARFYGVERGDLELGYLDVSIPETHRYGELESQSRWSIYTYVLGEEAKKKRYVLLLKIEPLAEENFYATLQDQIQSSPSDDVFIFVHGYSSSFEDAARRVAQLAYDLDFDGTPMMYSWPSQGTTAAYTVDEAAVRIGGRKMSRFIEDVAAKSGADRIHLIAHSMGNRRESAEPEKIFDQIVFTAPDVDRDYFVEVIDNISRFAQRVTLYASDNDVALQWSKIFHGAPRAGLAGDTIVTSAGLDTIDMSAVEADVLGHSYFAASQGAIHDLFRLFWQGEPPHERCGMGERSSTLASFWSFNADDCKGTDLLEASVLLKRFGQGARARVKARIDALSERASESAKQEWIQILDRLDSLLAVDDS
jgi:esterase/lipase superfamily enzyme